MERCRFTWIYCKPVPSGCRGAEQLMLEKPLAVVDSRSCYNFPIVAFPAHVAECVVRLVHKGCFFCCTILTLRGRRSCGLRTSPMCAAAVLRYLTAYRLGMSEAQALGALHQGRVVQHWLALQADVNLPGVHEDFVKFRRYLEHRMTLKLVPYASSVSDPHFFILCR